MDGANLYTFPSCAVEGLAFLYMQNQDIYGLTPEQIYDQYKEVLDKMIQRRNDTAEPMIALKF